MIRLDVVKGIFRNFSLGAGLLHSQYDPTVQQSKSIFMDHQNYISGKISLWQIRDSTSSGVVLGCPIVTLLCHTCIEFQNWFQDIYMKKNNFQKNTMVFCKESLKVGQPQLLAVGDPLCTSDSRLCGALPRWITVNSMEVNGRPLGNVHGDCDWCNKNPHENVLLMGIVHWKSSWGFDDLWWFCLQAQLWESWVYD